MRQVIIQVKDIDLQYAAAGLLAVSSLLRFLRMDAPPRLLLLAMPLWST